MKRKKEGEEWHGKISYQDHEEEIEDPSDVEKKIREGVVIGLLIMAKMKVPKVLSMFSTP